MIIEQSSYTGGSQGMCGERKKEKGEKQSKIKKINLKLPFAIYKLVKSPIDLIKP